MSVYQVNEFYVTVEIEPSQKALVVDFLNSEEGQDLYAIMSNISISDDEIYIDGFESEYDAEKLDDALQDLLK